MEPLDSHRLFPEEPIERIVRPLTRFVHVEAAGGIALLLASLTALAFANSPLADHYQAFWKAEVGVQFGSIEFEHSLKHLINDGLMVLFFFLIGLEVKREIVLGELRDLRIAMLPIVAAIGGMVMPAGVYLAVQWGQSGVRGWGIPMATDIAFVVGCMLILGSRVPRGLRVTLLSLAIADDIGAILVIALGYTEAIHFRWLGLGLAGIFLVSVLARLGTRSFGVYTIIGIVIWFAFHESGIHATIAGVILGLMTPAREYVPTGLLSRVLGQAHAIATGGDRHRRADRVRHLQLLIRETISPLEYLERSLHPWVSFVVMPLFALANAGVAIELSALSSGVGLAVALGLVVGKPLGIMVASWIAVRAGIARLPKGVTWLMMLAGGFLAGIGFTMSLFITALALPDKELQDFAKIGVLFGSTLSCLAGIGLLLLQPRARTPAGDE